MSDAYALKPDADRQPKGGNFLEGTPIAVEDARISVAWCAEKMKNDNSCSTQFIGVAKGNGVCFCAASGGGECAQRKMEAYLFTQTKCTGVDALTTGTVTKSRNDQHGSVATFDCDDGFELEGAVAITCEAASADTAWPTPPTCGTDDDSTQS